MSVSGADYFIYFNFEIEKSGTKKTSDRIPAFAYADKL